MDLSLKDRYTAARRRIIDDFFSRMNPMQKQAVYTLNGPVLILAGAGSGKTTVIINRIADGYYYSRAIRLAKHLLEHPELLERPASEPVEGF